MSTIREHPILFNAPMVRAILEGRKTQTRRVAKLTASGRVARGGRNWHLDDPAAMIACPYGQPSDRLWVRETWGVISHAFAAGGERIDWEPDRPAMPIHEMPFGGGYYSGHVIYAADGGYLWAGDDDGGEPRTYWHPSIHMPRWASRITLEVTGVHMERLRDISEADATAEGARAVPWGTWWQGYQDLGDDLIHQEARGEAPPEWMIEPKRMKDRPWLDRSAVAEFRILWESINGPASWDANPWVWVVEFRRIEEATA